MRGAGRTAFTGFLLACWSQAAAAAELKPNIVVILCDDLGYGDVRHLNPEGKIATPRLDGIANAGMVFSDAHSGSSVCSPTRYGLLTGRYAWRTKLQRHVLGGLSPRLIEPGRATVASMLKERGYHTACVGKWHLGLDWVVKPGKSISPLSIETAEQVQNVDYSRPFGGGPLTVGFDEYFGISGSLDMVPYTFLRNDHVAVLPVAEKSFPLMYGRPERGTRVGPAAPEFEAEQVLPALTAEAVRIVRERGPEAKSGSPFFLYLPLASPHTPIAPTAEWLGKSGLNPYADFVMQTDACIGEVMDEIDRQGIGENTLVIVTSDNGCSPEAKFDELAAKGHDPSYKFRGLKADIFEGGHRVPLLVRWPGQVKAGSTSQQLVCLTDLFATIAEIVGAKVPDNAAEDSFSFLPALRREASSWPRRSIVHHSINGSFAIREGSWKLALCRDSGGWSEPRPGAGRGSLSPQVQLYDLDNDIGEAHNRANEKPDLVQRLTDLLEKTVTQGRSTPGSNQSNAVEINVRVTR
jgi:arylsulfatase A-like enzyme